MPRRSALASTGPHPMGTHPQGPKSQAKGCVIPRPSYLLQCGASATPSLARTLAQNPIAKYCKLHCEPRCGETTTLSEQRTARQQAPPKQGLNHEFPLDRGQQCALGLAARTRDNHRVMQQARHAQKASAMFNRPPSLSSRCTPRGIRSGIVVPSLSDRHKAKGT